MGEKNGLAFFSSNKPSIAKGSERDRLKKYKAVFFSGLNQITCTNGDLKPDFFLNLFFRFRAEGKGGGSVEVRGMEGRHAGRRRLKKMGKKKFKKVKQKVSKLYNFKTFPASHFFGPKGK